MAGMLALALALSAPPPPPANAAPPRPAEITVAALKRHVNYLASPELVGRRGPGAVLASRYVADAFERLHLEPAFGSSYFQPFPAPGGGEAIIGRNVAAVLPGSDPDLADEWIVLSAHFDHLGKRGKVIYPGADDNASGVAMLLEVAGWFAGHKERPRRTVMFVSFDQEEAGLLGSQYFAAHPPRDFRKLKVFLNADMLGRSMANVMDEFVFALGSEKSPRLRRLLEEVRPADGLKVGRVGIDLIGTRSDYGPFRDRRVPFLFFSTGQHPDYHRPTDLPGRIDYVKLQKISAWIGDLTARLANDAEAPVWDEKALPPDLEEARAVHLLLSRILDAEWDYPLTPEQEGMVRRTRDRLGGILDRGKITAGERAWLVWTSQLLMVSIF